MKPKKMWAWWDNKTEKFCFLYDSKKKVELCFQYGSKVAEEKGNGKLVEVMVVPAEWCDEQVAAYLEICAKFK